MSSVTTKAKKIIDKTGDAVTSNPKTAVYVVGGILAIVTVVGLLKSLKKATGNDTIDDSVGGTGGSSSNTGTATISNSQAINYAQQLLDAMNEGRDTYFASGTDEDTIEAVFDKLKSGADFLKVYHAFGKKDYDGYESPPDGGVWQALETYYPRDLVFWLKSEISSFWEPTLYNKVKLRVESAGFVF